MEGVDLFFTIAYDIMIGTSRMGQIKLNNEAVVKFGLLHDCQYLKRQTLTKTYMTFDNNTHIYTQAVQKELYKKLQKPKGVT